MAWYDITGTVADWVMAGAAVYAAVNAKQWFSQRSHTKGFDKAEEIISKIDIHFRERNDYLKELHMTYEFLMGVDARSVSADPALLDKYESLSKKHTDIIALIDKLEEETILIERWSITIIDIELVKSIIKALRVLNVSAANSFSSTRSCLYNYNYIGINEFEDSHIYFKTHYEEFRRDLHSLEVIYDKFKRTQFKKIFKVN